MRCSEKFVLYISDLISFLCSHLDKMADIFTIGGVFFAIITYLSWTKNYKKQKSHDYSLYLLKEFKKLHLLVEDFRRPKMFDDKEILETIEKDCIPYFEEKIKKAAINIQNELLIAGYTLIGNEKLLEKFNESIIKNVISPFNYAIVNFNFDKRDEKKFNPKETDLFLMIFPSEKNNKEWEIKKSMLGTGNEVVDDDFNRKIEGGFKEIYKELENSLFINNKKEYKN